MTKIRADDIDKGIPAKVWVYKSSRSVKFF